MRFRKLIRLLSNVDYSLVDIVTGEVYAWNNKHMYVVFNNANFLNMKVVNSEMKKDELIIYVKHFKF